MQVLRKRFFQDLINYCSLVHKEYEQGKQNRCQIQCTAQAVQRNWQGYLHSLNKQQFFGIVRKGHYLSIFKELSTRMVQQNAQVILLFNGKVGDVNIYSVVLATNSYGESWDLSCESIESQIKQIYKSVIENAWAFV